MIYFFLFVCLVMLANLVFGELVKGEGNSTLENHSEFHCISGRMFEILFPLKD